MESISQKHKNILEKWLPIIEKDTLTDEEYKVKYGRDKPLNKTAMLLEGQEQWINFQNETHH
jgi:hypothetical protein